MAWFVKWLKSLENEARSTQRVRGVLDKTEGVRPAEELAPKETLLILTGKVCPTQPPVDHRKETFTWQWSGARHGAYHQPQGVNIEEKPHFTSTVLGGLHTNE